MALGTSLCLLGVAAAANGDETAITPKVYLGGGDDNESLSGPAELKDVTFGNGLTECPQAGLRDTKPKPLDRLQKIIR